MYGVTRRIISIRYAIQQCFLSIIFYIKKNVQIRIAFILYVFTSRLVTHYFINFSVCVRRSFYEKSIHL